MAERDFCKGCLYWYDLKNGDGECRKHPPVVVGSDEYEEGFFTAWPITLAREWCGEGEWR